MKYKLNIQYFGGRGASSNMDNFTQGEDDKTRGNGKTDSDFAARMNVQMKNGKMSPEIVLQNFRKTFTLDEEKGKIEHLIAVDSQGFTHTLNHGGTNSVSVSRSDARGKLVIHNHPNDGIFSRADLRAASTNGSTGIVASGKSGDYVFKVGKKFNSKGFNRALSKSPVTDKYYTKKGETQKTALARVNRESSTWLKANAKKYGYTFEYIKYK